MGYMTILLGAEIDAEAGGWQVRATSKWTALCAGRGGGEWVQVIGETTTNATDGGQ